MLGHALQAEDRSRWANGSIWVHAVSVGEVTAARAMLPLLGQAFPQWPILLTTHTETGQAQAKQLEGSLAAAVRYYPLDFSWTVNAFADVYKPRLFIPMETELWPNALNIFADRGSQIFVLNGKISERSFQSYMKVRGLIRQPLSRVKAFCMQTSADAHRIGSLSGDGPEIQVTGNCKFDSPLAAPDTERRAELEARCFLTEGSIPVVAGSTHQGEEELIIAAWQRIAARFPQAKLLLVPRHPERFKQVWELLLSLGLPVRRVSDGATAGNGDTSIVLVDEMGVLASLYSVARVAIIAGSFVPGIGGHNLLEAAGHGVPVIYGPHMSKQPDMVRILTPQNGGTIAATSAEIAEGLTLFLGDRSYARRIGEKGRRAFDEHRGSAQRNLEIILKHVKAT